MVFYYTRKRVSAVPDQPSSVRCRWYKIKYKGTEASLYSFMKCNSIIPKTECCKLICNYVTDFLSTI